MCSSSDAKQQPLQDGPGGIGEWQQEGLPLWVDLSEGGAAGQGNTGPLAASGEEWGAARREEPAGGQLAVRAQAGLTWTACLCLSLSPEVPGGQLGTGVCVCGGEWWWWYVGGLPREPWRAWKGSLGGQSW